MRNSTCLSILMAIGFIAIFQTTTLAQVNKSDALKLVKQHYAALNLPADESNYFISDAYMDQRSGMSFIYVQQQYQGIKVFNRIVSSCFRDGQPMYASGVFIRNMDQKAGTSIPAITASSAVVKAAEHLQLSSPVSLQVISDLSATEKKIIFNSGGIARGNIEAALCWVSNDEGNSVRLAWNINIDVAGKSDWWNVRVDAINGTVINKDNWTVYEQPLNQSRNFVSRDCPGDFKSSSISSPLSPSVTSGAYNVVPFPNENRNVAGISVDNNPWLKAGVGNNATTNGWHYDGTLDYDVTRGNNAHAYLDLNNSNTTSATNVPAASTTAIPALNFNFVPDFALQPADATNRNFALTNLFYWNNLMHDLYYQYGFDEAGGNFQADNLGRGGLGSDYVQAEAQDGGGTNNANFATPTDGSRPRMQMYIFSGVPSFVVNSPAVIAGSYQAVESGFSANNKLANVGPVTGQVIYYNDNPLGTLHEACTGAPTNNISGKIAMINRGNCNFTVKVKNAQNAGAIAVIMVNNVPGAPITMGGTDNTITIPAIMISQADGQLIAAQLSNNVNVTMAAGVDIDGDLDNGVVTHEYGHGISNRLTGGPSNTSCLNNAEEGGEGWSDYVALMITTNWATTTINDINKPRPVGTYALGEPLTGAGIRRYPYCYDMGIDPLTYGNMDATASGGEVHNIGEIWCSALWDMTWEIIKQQNIITPNIYSSSEVGGNVVALNLVLMGMKLQPCSPGFLDARNAILAADSILYAGKYKCAIWRAFARRGMGYTATQGSSNNTGDHSPAFDLPGKVTLAKNVSAVAIANGAQYTINLQASCGCATPSNYRITDTIPAGFTYNSNTGGGTVNGNVVSFSGINFASSNETKSFSITVTASGTGCTIDSVINDNRDGSTIGGLTATANAGPNNFRENSGVSYNGVKSWFGIDGTDACDFVLTSNPFTPQNMTVLSFWQRYAFEDGIDGGRVEISTNNGATWDDAGPYIFQRTYGSSMTAAPWGSGQMAYSGSTNAQFVHALVNLVPFSGQSVRIRFRVQTNTGNTGTYEGWFIDDIIAMRGCGGYSKTVLFDNLGAVIDTAMQPLYIKPGFATGIFDPTIAANSIKVYPNPANSECTIAYHIAERSKTTISVVNISGQQVATYNKGTLLPGNYNHQVDTKTLPAGMYMIVLESGGKKIYKKLTVAH